MSQVHANNSHAERAVFDNSKDLWQAIKVEACRSLLTAWSGIKVKSNMKKPDAIEGLIDNAFSVDFARVYGWRELGVTDPGPNPVDGVGARDWAVDRAFFLLMTGGVISEHGLLQVEALDLNRFVRNPGDTQAPAESVGAESPATTLSPCSSIVSLPPATTGSPSLRLEETGTPGPTTPSLGTDPGAITSSSASSQPATTMDSSSSGAPQTVSSQLIPVPSAPASGPNTASSTSGLNMGTTVDCRGPSLGSMAITSAATTMTVGNVQPSGSSTESGLTAVVPSTGVADDPYWLYLCHVIQGYGFMTHQGTQPEFDARGLPLARSGRLLARGRIALFGVDRRPNSQGGPLLCIVENVQLSYVPGTVTVMASSVDTMQALHRDPRLQQGNLLISVSLGLNQTTADYTLGSISAQRALTMAPAVEVPVFTLARDSPTVLYQGIWFGTSFEVVPLNIPPSVQSGPATDSKGGRGRHSKTVGAKTARASKKPPKAPRFTAEEMNDALVEWIGTVHDGKYASDEVVIRIQESANEGSVSYDELMEQLEVISELNNLGYGDRHAPPAARGKKITQIAIADFLGRSVGWVQNAITVQRNLTLYAKDRRVKAFIKEHMRRAVGVKTFFEGLGLILAEPLAPEKGKKCQHPEEEAEPFQDDYEGGPYKELSP